MSKIATVEKNSFDSRIRFIDIARGTAIIMVVWAHADLRTNPVFYETYLRQLHGILSSAHTPLLFMISAILILPQIYEKELKPFIERSIKRLLYPFYALSMVFFIINVLAPSSLGLPTAAEMAKTLATLSTGDSLPSGILWFLLVLFLFNVTTFLLIRKAKLNLLYILLIAIGLKLLHPHLKDIYFLGIRKFVQLYIFYVVGLGLSRHLKFLNKMKLSLVITCSVFTFCFWLINYSSKIYYPIISLGLGLFGSFFVLTICIILSRNNCLNILKIPEKFLSLCGKKSMAIFVFHTSSFVPAVYLTQKFNLTSSIYGFMIIFTFGVGFPLLIEKILASNKKIYTLLLGRAPS